MKTRKSFLFLVVMAFMSSMFFASFTFAGSYTQLTTTGAYWDIGGRISPDGSRVVFFSNRSGNWDIYVINIDGTNLTQLTTDGNNDYQPHWSPDGTKIVFKSNRSGHSNIWTMDPDGSNKTQLTTYTNGYDILAPPSFGADFSPDGTKIVYDCNATGNHDIWVMDSDGLNKTRLTTDSARDAHPCFSPDGTKIVFWSERSGNKDIYIMNFDGSSQIQLTTDSAPDFHPHFNHDGTQIGFVSRRDGEFKIYTMNVDGSSQTRKFSDSYFDAGLAWNSDGSKQVFSKDWDGSGYVHLWLYEEDQGAVGSVTYSFWTEGNPYGSSEVISLFDSSSFVSGIFAYDNETEATGTASAGHTLYGGATSNLVGSVDGMNFSDPGGFIAVGNDTFSREYITEPGVDFLQIGAEPPHLGDPGTRNISGFVIGDYTLINVRMFWIEELLDITDFLDNQDLPAALPSFEGRLALDFVQTNSPDGPMYCVFFDGLYVQPGFQPPPPHFQPSPPQQKMEYPELPAKKPTAKNLVFITHGWNSSIDEWAEFMANSINGYIIDNGNVDEWDVWPIDWSKYSSSPTGGHWLDAPDPNQAFVNGQILGKDIGRRLAAFNYNYDHIHFIAHSAGSALIDKASSCIKDIDKDSPPTIHCTFLDAYDPAGDKSTYGLNATWAEQYVDIRPITLPGFQKLDTTDTNLKKCFNFNITGLDPEGWYGPIPDKYIRAHAWPYMFYIATIGPDNTNNYIYSYLYPSPYGFSLSLESGLSVNDFMLNKQCYPPGGKCNVYDQVCQTYSVPASKHIYNYNDAIDFFAAQDRNEIILSNDGTVEFDNSMSTQAILSPGSPVWMSIILEVTEPINILSLDYEFLAGSDGLLSVAFDNEVVSKIDERVTYEGSSNAIWLGEVELGPHLLSFRLDPFEENQAVVKIANVRTGVMKVITLPPADLQGPIVSNVSTDLNPVQISNTVYLTALVNDTETGNSNIQSAEYSLDNGATWTPMNAQDGYFDSPSEQVEWMITVPGTPGVYDLCIRGTDNYDNIGPENCILLVVYDPDGGFVTGGGWIDSPAGSYLPDPTLTGKASFGFVSKYKKGATIPTGQTEFQFQTADLNFHSSSYDWLVVTGSNYAKFKGSGTINGAGDYKFMLWAGDGYPDTFRIRIWEEDEVTAVETVAYDNGFDQDIGGGSIVIHKK